jgi:hypothetical protein
VYYSGGNFIPVLKTCGVNVTLALNIGNRNLQIRTVGGTYPQCNLDVSLLPPNTLSERPSRPLRFEF